MAISARFVAFIATRRGVTIGTSRLSDPNMQMRLSCCPDVSRVMARAGFSYRT